MVKKILVSQPKPTSEKSPYFDIARKFEVELVFRPFIKVEGMSAKEFREAYGLRKDEPIRPYMTTDQLKLMDCLQQFDVGFVVSIPDYKERRTKLEWCAAQLTAA